MDFEAVELNLCFEAVESNLYFEAVESNLYFEAVEPNLYFEAIESNFSLRQWMGILSLLVFIMETVFSLRYGLKYKKQLTV